MSKYDTSPKRCQNFKRCGVTMTFPHIKNESAEVFWRRIIADYSNGNFSDEWSDKEPEGPMQKFDSERTSD